MNEMRAIPTGLADVVEIRTARHEDSRGHFSETFRQDWFAAEVANVSFVQDNQSLNAVSGTIRGLHAQDAPFAQGKLMRCLTGSIFDVAVDVRRGSPHFGKWVAMTLSADEGNQLWIPPGFLHGYCTLGDNCLVAYKVTSYYNRDNSKGVRWDDPEIGIAWPAIADPRSLSVADQSWPTLEASAIHFDMTRDS